VTATQVEGELVRAFKARPPLDPHTADVLTWPKTYLTEKRHIDAAFDRRMAVKSQLGLTHWLKAFGRFYATHRRNWMEGCTLIATAITALRRVQARGA